MIHAACPAPASCPVVETPMSLAYSRRLPITPMLPFKNRPESSSKLVIMSVIETLKINFVQVNPGSKIVQYLLGTVSVGDKASHEPGGAGFLENGNPPFRGDQRLIVGTYENLGPLLESGGN